MTALFAAVFAALYAAHEVADHWLQTPRQALGKDAPGWPGRRACAAHVAVLTAAMAAALAAVTAVTSAPAHPAAGAAGLAVNAVSHYAADRRRPLQALAGVIGKGEFWSLGVQRPGRDGNGGPGTGSYALDQAWHTGWLLLTALIIAGGSR